METEQLCCEKHEVHKEKVENARKKLNVLFQTENNNEKKDEVIQSVASFFKCLGDPTRVKILSSLVGCEMCVCDLSELLLMTDSAISHQLKLLKDAKLVKSRRDGRNIFYSLDDEHIEVILQDAIEHINE